MLHNANFVISGGTIVLWWQGLVPRDNWCMDITCVKMAVIWFCWGLNVPNVLIRGVNVDHSVSLYPDNKVHGANMGPTWVLLAPDGLHVGPINLAIRVVYYDQA